MSSSVERFDDKARQTFSRYGQTVVHRGELLRHPVYTRVLHWCVAISFVLSLLSGFAIYSPWLYSWLTPLFGGGPMTRFLHPWFGVAFTIAFFFQFLNWFAAMLWTGADRRWMGQLKAYVTNRETVAPKDTGFFNGGQKLYYWTIAVCAVIFLITGVLLWFDHVVARWLVAVSYVLHGLAALAMLAGFIIHIYQSTAAQPGTFQSMTNGTVTNKWAWTHHPAWYADVTGRDPGADYEEERRRLIERYRVDDRERLEDRQRDPVIASDDDRER